MSRTTVGAAGPAAEILAGIFSLRFCGILGTVLASTGVAGAGFARFHARYAWLFLALSAAFLLLAFHLSVLRRPSRGTQLTFVVMSLVVAGLSFWPSLPGLAGWLIAGLSVALAAITLWTLLHTRVGRTPVANPGLTLHVSGMT